MTLLAVIGAIALLVGAFYAGLKLGAKYMVDITTMAAQQSGVDPIRFGDALDVAKRDFQRGKRPWA